MIDAFNRFSDMAYSAAIVVVLLLAYIAGRMK